MQKNVPLHVNHCALEINVQLSEPLNVACKN